MGQRYGAGRHVLRLGMFARKFEYGGVDVIVEETQRGEEYGADQREADGEARFGDVYFGQGGVEIPPETYEG